jgi:sigma-54-dependent transcriptional regulator
MKASPCIGRDTEPAENTIEYLTDQFCDNITESLEAIEEAIVRRIIARTLRKTGGNQTKAARLLGIKRRTLNYKIKKLNIRVE